MKVNRRSWHRKQKTVDNEDDGHYNVDKGNEKRGENMKKETLTEEKVKQRWQQMEEMNQIWETLSEREKGYLEGSMNTVIALAGTKVAS